MPSSYYEELKVARDAPGEVIRAAYRVLARLHHPDINPSEESAKQMASINVAFETLSDKSKRVAYDAWLKSQECNSASESNERGFSHKRSAPTFSTNSPLGSKNNNGNRGVPKNWRWWLLMLFAGIFLAYIFGDNFFETQGNNKYYPQSVSPSLENPEQIVAMQLRSKLPIYIPSPKQGVAITAVFSEKPGSLTLRMIDNSGTQKSTLEGSTFRALRISKSALCKKGGVLDEYNLHNSRITIEVYENGAQVENGHILLPSTFCN